MVSHYIVKIPTSSVKGEPELYPTSFEEEKSAHKKARELNLARVNRVCRIDDTVYVYCVYVVIGPCCHHEALAKAKKEEPYKSIRKDHRTPYRQIHLDESEAGV